MKEVQKYVCEMLFFIGLLSLLISDLVYSVIYSPNCEEANAISIVSLFFLGDNDLVTANYLLVQVF